MSRNNRRNIGYPPRNKSIYSESWCWDDELGAAARRERAGKPRLPLCYVPKTMADLDRLWEEYRMTGDEYNDFFYKLSESERAKVHA